MSVGPTISNANTISNRMETQSDFQSRVSNPYASKYGSTPATLKGSSSQAGPASSVSGNTIPSSSVLPSKAATSLAASNRSMGLSGVGGASTAMIGGGIPGGQGSSKSGSGSSGSGGSSSRSGSSGGGGGGGRSSVVTAPGNVSVVPSSVAASQASSNRTMGLPGLTTQQPFITTTGTGTSLISQQKDIIQGPNINDYSNMNLKNTNVNYAGRGVAGPVGYGGTTSPTLPMWSPGSNQNANVYNVKGQGLGTSNIPSSSLAPVTTYPVVKDVTYTVGDLNKMAKDMESERKALERETKQLNTTSPYSPEMMQQAENARTLTRITAEYNNKLDKTEADQKAFFASVEKLGYNVVPVKEKNVITGYTFESPQVATASNKAQVDAYMAKANAFNEKANFLNAAGKVMSYVEPVVYTPKTGWAKAEQTVSIKAFGVAGTKNEGILPGKPYLPNEAYPGTGRISQVARGIYRTGTEKPLTVAAIGVGGFVAGAAVPVVAASFTGIAGTTAAGTAITYGALGTKLAGGAALGFGLGASGASVALSPKPWEALGEQTVYLGAGIVGGVSGAYAGSKVVAWRMQPNAELSPRTLSKSELLLKSDKGMLKGFGQYDLSVSQRSSFWGPRQTTTQVLDVVQSRGLTSAKTGSSVWDTYLSGKNVDASIKTFQESSGKTSSFISVTQKGKAPLEFFGEGKVSLIDAKSPYPSYQTYVGVGNEPVMVSINKKFGKGEFQYFTGESKLYPAGEGKVLSFSETGKFMQSGDLTYVKSIGYGTPSPKMIPVKVSSEGWFNSVGKGSVWKNIFLVDTNTRGGSSGFGWNSDEYFGRTIVDKGVTIIEPKASTGGVGGSSGSVFKPTVGSGSGFRYVSPVVSQDVPLVNWQSVGSQLVSSVPIQTVGYGAVLGFGSVGASLVRVGVVSGVKPLEITKVNSYVGPTARIEAFSPSLSNVNVGVSSLTESTSAAKSVSSSSSVTEVTNIFNVPPIVPVVAVPTFGGLGFGLPNLPGVPKEYRPKVSIPLRKKRKGGSPSLLQFTKGLVPTGGLKVNVTGFEAVRGTGIKRMNMGSVLKGTAPRVNPFAKLMRKPNKSKLKFDLRMAA